MSLIRLLTNARNLVAEHWTQGEMFVKYDSLTAYCITGAVWEATGSRVRKEPTPEYYQLVGELRVTLGSDGLEDWNDDVERTQEQVVRLFDDTIKRLQEQRVVVREEDLVTGGD
jgi:hypothetical protein